MKSKGFHAEKKKQSNKNAKTIGRTIERTYAGTIRGTECKPIRAKGRGGARHLGPPHAEA